MLYDLSITLLLLLVSFQNHQIVVISQSIFTLKKQENKTYHGNVLVTFNGTKINECLQHCLKECQCLSFDICCDTSQCRLLTFNSQIESERLNSSKGCNYFEFEQENNQQCDNHRSCISAVNCCLTSKPCENGGTCLPPRDKNERFHCACPEKYFGKRCEKCIPGYTGNLCEQRITSCRGYANGSRVPGNYTILDASGVRYTVYCDFDTNSSMTWTLIQSYSRKNVNKFLKPYSENLPKSENFISWDLYRLSTLKMQSIQNNSSEWRITCDFQKYEKVHYTDYLRGLKLNVDILTFVASSGACQSVEYINVRGHNCSKCTTLLYQASYFPLHFDSLRSLTSSCDFKAYNETQCQYSENIVSGEDNFGMYKCINNEHRCSATETSKTQTWMGG